MSRSFPRSFSRTRADTETEQRTGFMDHVMDKAKTSYKTLKHKIPKTHKKNGEEEEDVFGARVDDHEAPLDNNNVDNEHPKSEHVEVLDEDVQVTIKNEA